MGVESAYADWIRQFAARAEERGTGRSEPDWGRAARLRPEIVRSVQRFQVGESGDGANLLRKAAAAGPSDYADAARLFVAEEQNHARLLAMLLGAADAPLLAWHWSDAVFVRLRRALGLRLELMVLLIAEVVALGYYRALRDGAGDGLTSRVAGLILTDERGHVPFHCQRLRAEFARWPRWARRAIDVPWSLLLCGTVLLVAFDHGPALRRLGVGKWQFVDEVTREFRAAVRSVLRITDGRKTTAANVAAAGVRR